MIGRKPDHYCGDCHHIHGWATGDPKCDAFPLGIPEKILFGDFDHVNPYPGDQGIRYEYDAARVEELRRGREEIIRKTNEAYEAEAWKHYWK